MCRDFSSLQVTIQEYLTESSLTWSVRVAQVRFAVLGKRSPRLRVNESKAFQNSYRPKFRVICCPT